MRATGTNKKTPAKAAPKPSGLWARRSIKTLIALVIAGVLGWVPLQRLIQTTSAEALVNARLITLRAPIDGEIIASHDAIEAGATVNPGEKILRIVNQRADRGRLDDLRRTIAALKSESGALAYRLVELKRFQDDLRLQKDAFQSGRILQLQARIDEIAAQIAGAEAQKEDTAGALDRAKKLRKSGFQSVAVLMRASRDDTVAGKSIEALRARLRATRVELDAARQGLFVGDSYNDIPRSAQRVDEIQQQIVETKSHLQERKIRLKGLEGGLAEEEQRFADLSTAVLSVPLTGRIWEVLIAPGEEVRKGQDLLRVLDCGVVIVTAAVSESVYNALRIGGAATFRLRGDSQEHEGRIVGLNGLAVVPSNLAIAQNALVREPYHVSVTVPDLGMASDCSIGRTGKVTFETGSKPYAALHTSIQ